MVKYWKMSARSTQAKTAIVGVLAAGLGVAAAAASAPFATATPQSALVGHYVAYSAGGRQWGSDVTDCAPGCLVLNYGAPITMHADSSGTWVGSYEDPARVICDSDHSPVAATIVTTVSPDFTQGKVSTAAIHSKCANGTTLTPSPIRFCSRW
jgi:opacity protein-like surface antigen